MHTAPFGCTAHLACLNVHMVRVCHAAGLVGSELTVGHGIGVGHAWIGGCVGREDCYQRPHGCHSRANVHPGCAHRDDCRKGGRSASPVEMAEACHIDMAQIPDAFLSRPHGERTAAALLPHWDPDKRGKHDGLAGIVSLRVQAGGCRRSSLGASTGRRCFGLTALKMGRVLPAQ
ncbi:hypothetical protein BDU57DRAFT_125282 [Ampelomyces quisqualis]|uniref:Uncharacterized protein n=1 Tax=Ampelomyces quisqualis TaxID=50730 RepID=A0A6A5QVQ5_AMPQU|nr:hypothetical protein BDU57DRAFT_125282 [Ampelomyces quisqualis]